MPTDKQLENEINAIQQESAELGQRLNYLIRKRSVQLWSNAEVVEIDEMLAEERTNKC